jgi:hypothetical protein
MHEGKEKGIQAFGRRVRKRGTTRKTRMML